MTALEGGDLPDPDLEVRWPAGMAERILRGELDGTEALAATTVVHAGYEGPPAPMDLAERPELADVPVTPDADLLVQYLFTAGPFGPVRYWMRFTAGRHDGMGLGEVDEPDVRVRISFLDMALVRKGDLSVYEALEGGGRADGDIGPLMLLAGLQEEPGIQRAERACGPSGIILGVLGQMAGSEAHQEGVARLLHAWR